MSIHQLTQTPICLPFMPTKMPTRRITTNMKKRPHMPSNEVRACASSSKSGQHTVIRRSANYKPCIWDYGFVQSLESDYVGEKYITQSNKLKEEVRVMLQTVVEPLDQLQLIDILQRLGLSYHFNDEIKGLLETIYSNNNKWEKEDLYGVALKFRLLRQHGYLVSQEVFRSFTDVNGNFKENICKDTKGMLSLYEASYLSMDGESLLVEARNFTAKHLKDYDSNDLSIDVNHALELPLYWRMLRLEARRSIDVYQRQQDKKSVILELAKLDFNMVQAIHQEDLKHMSRWWRSTCLGEKLSFARDRLMENFFWTVGVIFEPQFGYCRRMSTKVNALITTIDDVYDVYGSLDELEIFTDVVRRWDINAIDVLPGYMKLCFLALFNTVNKMAYDALRDQDCNIIKYLKKSWADLCESYLLEAKWYYSGYTPTLEEYIDNAWISISGPVILVHAYFFVTNPITKEALECLEKYPNIIRWSSLILRLADDLGTSSDELNRGDVPKSIQCYMYETGASQEDARNHIRYLISKTWEKINEEVIVSTSPFSETFIGIAMNLARMAQCMYQHGDGHGVPDRETKDRVLSLLIQPIP